MELRFTDFSGYDLSTPTKKEYPNGVFYMLLGDTWGQGDPHATKYQDAFKLQPKEVRIISADTPEHELPYYKGLFNKEHIDLQVHGFDIAIYGYAEAGRGVEKRIIEKATKAYEAYDFS